MPWSHGHRLVQEKKWKKNGSFQRKRLTSIDFLKARGWSGHIIAASTRPKASTKKQAMSPSSAVHGGQLRYQICDIRVDIASGIRGRQNLGLLA